MSPRVQVVVVSWRSAEHVGEAVASVPGGVPVVVVDNASPDRSAEVAERAGAHVVRSPTNLGFGPGCNEGARTGPGNGSETVLFLNPDAALEDGPDCLSTLLAALDADPTVGAVAPALLGDGQEVFQLRRLPTLGSLAREAFLVNRLAPRNRGLLAERYLDRDRSEPFDVEQPAAAALLVRRSVFEAVGGFDPALAPAWFEDVDLCARILESGYRIRFVPAARVRHAGGASMTSLAYRDFLPVYHRNLLRYLRRHRSAGVRVAARGLLAAGALLRLLALPFVSGEHGRAETATGYGRVLLGLAGLGWRSALLAGGGR